MYKYIGLAMMGIFAMMVIPGNIDAQNNDGKFYGMLTFTQKDAAGNEIFSQSIHNQVVDTGEDFLLDATFQDGATDVADNVQIGSICISDAGTFVVAETETAADFDGDNTITEANCKEDTTVTTSGGIATIGALTFAAGGTNAADGDTITGIGICQNDATDDADFTDCATEGILFALVDTTDTTLNSGETVDITYTFDITSGSS